MLRTQPVDGSSPMRHRRLTNDYKRLQEMANNSEVVTIVKTENNPPDLYVVRFLLRGVEKLDGDGNPIYRDSHDVAIQLKAEHPRKKPLLRWLTPIFHPNIDWPSGTVCIGDPPDYGWYPARPLDDLVLYLGRMAKYEEGCYNPISPFKNATKRWSMDNTHLFPTDDRNVKGAKFDIDIGESITIGARGEADPDLLDEIRIG